MINRNYFDIVPDVALESGAENELPLSEEKMNPTAAIPKDSQGI